MSFTLPRALLIEDRLVFDRDSGIEDATHLGAFFLQCPQDFDPAPALNFARAYFLGTDATTVPEMNLDWTELAKQTHRRSNHQVEQLIIGRECRSKLLPKSVLTTTETMVSISGSVLREVLRFAEVPIHSWEKLTGKASSNNGTHWMVFNSYHHVDQPFGCAAHQDTGFVTTLYIDQSGLEFFWEGSWHDCPPMKDHLLVIFGLGLANLTKPWRRRIEAPTHRVRRISSEQTRLSLAAFASLPTGGEIYALDENGTTHTVAEVDDFLRAHDLATWGS